MMRRHNLAEQRIYRACRDAGFPRELRGIVFFGVEAETVQAVNPDIASDYKYVFGDAFQLTDDQYNRIITILSEGRRNRIDPNINIHPQADAEANNDNGETDDAGAHYRGRRGRRRYHGRRGRQHNNDPIAETVTIPAPNSHTLPA